MHQTRFHAFIIPHYSKLINSLNIMVVNSLHKYIYEHRYESTWLLCTSSCHVVYGFWKCMTSQISVMLKSYKYCRRFSSADHYKVMNFTKQACNNNSWINWRNTQGPLTKKESLHLYVCYCDLFKKKSRQHQLIWEMAFYLQTVIFLKWIRLPGDNFIHLFI